MPKDNYKTCGVCGAKNPPGFPCSNCKKKKVDPTETIIDKVSVLTLQKDDVLALRLNTDQITADETKTIITSLSELEPVKKNNVAIVIFGRDDDLFVIREEKDE